MSNTSSTDRVIAGVQAAVVLCIAGCVVWVFWGTGAVLLGHETLTVTTVAVATAVGTAAWAVLIALGYATLYLLGYLATDFADDIREVIARD